MSYNSVTDEGLSHLAKLPSLRVVDLKGTRITKAGYKKLVEAAAGLRVLADESVTGVPEEPFGYGPALQR